MRNAVLGLRRDPATNAAMAGAFTQANSAELREQLGRPATDGELYIAHFLGATGAAKLIRQAATAPRVAAAGLFPAGAEANRAIFYDRRGHARSSGDVYSILVSRFEAARTHTATLATGAPTRVAPAIAAPEPAPDPAGTFDAFAMVSAVPVAKSEQQGPAFHSLFQTGGQRQPISPVVGALWGGGSADGVAMPAALRAGHLRGSVDGS
jgi:hypothetical protein